MVEFIEQKEENYLTINENTTVRSAFNPVTSGKLNVYKVLMLADQRKHKETFKRYNFQPKNKEIQKMSGHSQHQKLSKRNTHRFFPGIQILLQRFLLGRVEGFWC